MSTFTDLATALLASAAGGLGTRVPDRRYVSHNAAAWEACTEDQLTVHAVPLAVRAGTNDRRARQVLPLIAWHVQLARCVPGLKADGAAPTAAELNTSALGLLEDLHDITAAIQADGVFGGCNEVVWGQGIPLGPTGAMAGWDLVITAATQL
jgi:hypothetical protein